MRAGLVSRLVCNIQVEYILRANEAEHIARSLSNVDCQSMKLDAENFSLLTRLPDDCIRP